MPTDGARETRMAGAASYKGEKVGQHALQSWWLWSCQTAGSGGRGLNNKKKRNVRLRHGIDSRSFCQEAVLSQREGCDLRVTGRRSVLMSPPPVVLGPIVVTYRVGGCGSVMVTKRLLL